jgi:hypothetical protein
MTLNFAPPYSPILGGFGQSRRLETGFLISRSLGSIALLPNSYKASRTKLICRICDRISISKSFKRFASALRSISWDCFCWSKLSFLSFAGIDIVIYTFSNLFCITIKGFLYSFKNRLPLFLGNLG